MNPTPTQRNPRVSVIVPNYNYARYLDARITSILEQTCQDFELLLLDDASTDGSAEVIKRYKGNAHVSRIEINAQNTGSPFKQWMKGILLARGEWIWIAEADDVASPDFLSTCLQAVDKAGKNTAFCMVGSHYIDETGAVVTRDADYWNGHGRSGVCYFDGRQYTEHKLYWHNTVMNASGVLFRRTYALQLQHSRFLDMRYSGDWLFWVEMALQGTVVEVRRSLNFFRQHGQKVSVEGVSSGRRLMEDIEVIARMEEAFPHLPRYKKRLVHGMIVRKSLKVADGQMRTKLLERIKARLHGSVADVRLLHLNQWLKGILPFLTTMKRDRLSLDED